MKLTTLLAGVMLAATPALATDKPPVTPAPVTNNFFQKLEQRLTNRVENNLAQKQQQGQAQQQGQRQSQTATATGGAANNSNNVRIDNRTTVAPSIVGNGDTYAVSAAVAGVAGGIAVPSRAYGRGRIGDNIVRLSVDRTALYTQCGLPHTSKSLLLKGIRCDLDGAELIAWEAQFRPKAVVHKAATHTAKRRAPRATRCGC